MLDDSTTPATHIMNAAGHKLPDVSLSLEDFLVEDPVDAGLLGAPDEEHSRYTGNEGATIERVRLLACHVMYLDRSSCLRQ